MPQITYEQRREYKLKEKYGITPKDYNDMYVKQNGCCKICGTHQTELKHILVVDHNHDTGNVRGLLCRSCNVGLGHFKDNKDLLKIAIQYLETGE